MTKYMPIGNWSLVIGALLVIGIWSLGFPLPLLLHEGRDALGDALLGHLSSHVIVDRAPPHRLDFQPVPAGADGGADQRDRFGGDGFFAQPNAEEFYGA